MKEATMVTSVAMSDSKNPIVVTSESSPTAIAIRDGLLSDTRLAGADLNIQVLDNHVIVSGEVESEEQRDVALNIVGRYVGRDRVYDELLTPDQISYFCEA